MTNTESATYEETAPNSDAAKAAERAAREIAYRVATADGPYATGVDIDDVAESVGDEIAAHFGLAEQLAYDIAYAAADETVHTIWSS